jgi:soluble lytic murein transglycosylase-like protein
MTDNTTTAALLVALAGAAALMHRRVVAGEATPLSESEVRTFAENTVRDFDEIQADPAVMVRIAWIESAFDPSALRPEPAIADASAGLMQTLVTTARWLATDMGFDAFGRDIELKTLMGPQASLYFGGAYLTYLRTYRGQRRGEEFVVRSYNGGPGNFSEATAQYWQRYLEAKERFG